MVEKEIVSRANSLDGPTNADSVGIIHSPVDRPPPPLRYDIAFEEREGGFETWFSDRIFIGYQGVWLTSSPIGLTVCPASRT